jgi:hypothetical protein
MANADPHPESRQAPPSLIAASAQRGWLMAGVAIQHLEALGILPSKEERRKKPVRVSPHILMELSAALCLGAWEDGGLCQLLEEDSSSAYSVMDESVAKLTADPGAFARLDGLPPLIDKLFDLWVKRFAWSGLEDLNADVVLDLSESDEEGLLKDVAEFLWNHRHLRQDQPGS